MTMATVSHHADNAICHTCGFLTRFLVLCDHCHDSIPLRTTFTSDRVLARHEVNPPTSSVRATIAAAKALRRKYQSIVYELQQSCAELESFIAFQQARISPIKMLPADVLIEIFRFAVQGQGIITDFGPTALILSKVCSSWRRLTLFIPSLWSSFSVACQDSGWAAVRFCATNPVKALDLYLKRSTPSHLSIRLLARDYSYWGPSEPRPTSLSPLVLRKIQSVVPRISHLDILEDHLRSLVGSFTSLTCLHVRRHSWPAYAPQSFAFEAPQLQIAILETESALALPLKFEQLAELQLGKWRDAKDSNIDSDSVSLKSLSTKSLICLRCLHLYDLDLYPYNSWFSNLSGPIELPALEVLSVRILERHVTLRQFLTPKLVELAITSRYRGVFTPAYNYLDPLAASDPHDVETFLANSFCIQTLRRLALHGISISPSSLTKIIGAHPAINDLSLKTLHYFPRPEESLIHFATHQPDYTVRFRPSIDNEFLNNLLLSQAFPISRLSLETNKTGMNERTVLDIVLQSIENTTMEKFKLKVHRFFFGKEAVRTIQGKCRAQHGAKISIHTSVDASFLGRDVSTSGSGWGVSHGSGWGGTYAPKQHNGLLRIV